MKTILITGCSSGIGYETALLFHQNGYKVFAIVRDKISYEQLKTRSIEPFLADVRDYKRIDQIFAAIETRTVSLDIVFNNAGYGQPGALEDIKIDILKEQFDTNFFALHYVTQKAVALMRKNKNQGKIIQHGSVLGLISLRFRGAYNASKYAVEGLCDTLRLELKNTNIKVITLNTGPVISEFRNNAFKMFDKNIDKMHTHYKKEYENELAQRFNKNEKNTPFTLNASQAAQIIYKIAQKKNPKPRYYITKATYILSFFKRILPTSWLDNILFRI